MTRISSLLIATSFAILPVAAFAQQNAAPVQPAAPASQMSRTDGKTQASSVKTAVSAKDTRTTHAKSGTATPAKTSEPSKS